MRKASVVVVDENERRYLEKCAAGRRTPARLVLRAKIICSQQRGQRTSKSLSDWTLRDRPWGCGGSVMSSWDELGSRRMLRVVGVRAMRDKQWSDRSSR